MVDEEGNGDGSGGANYIDPRLCASHRKTLETKIEGIEDTLTTKIDGLRTTIVAAVSLSTAVISIIMYLLSIRGI